MRRKKLKMPEEFVKSKTKDAFSLYLTIANMEYLQSRVGPRNTSQVVDGLISDYVAELKDKKNV